MPGSTYGSATFEAGQCIFHEGDEPDFAYVIKEGSVRVTKRGSNGSEITISTIGKGGIVGEMAMVENTPRSATVIAETKVSLISVNKENFEKNLEGLDPFLSSLMRTLVKRLRRQNTQSVELAVQMEAVTRPGKPSKSTPPPARKARKNASFEEVSFLLGDAGLQARRDLRDGLFQNQFLDLKDSGNLEEFRSMIQDAGAADVMVIDSSLGLIDVSTLVQDVRNGTLGGNPFMGIIGTCPSGEDTFKDQLLDTGCDLVITKPFSMDQLIYHIKLLCKEREPFVVTSKYTGPDRTSGEGVDGGKSAPAMRPPNTLFSKVIEGESHEVTTKMVGAAIRKLHLMKISRESFQVAWLLDRIKPVDGVCPESGYFVDRVEEAIRIMMDRIMDTRISDQQKTLEDMLEVIGSSPRDGFPEESWQKLADFNLVIRDKIAGKDQNRSSAA